MLGGKKGRSETGICHGDTEGTESGLSDFGGLATEAQRTEEVGVDPQLNLQWLTRCLVLHPILIHS